MTQGPITSMQVAGHSHFLGALKAFQEAMQDVRKQMVNRDIEKERQNLFSPEFLRWLEFLSIPESRLAEPVVKKRRRRPRREAAWRPDPEILGGLAYHKEHEAALRQKMRIRQGPVTRTDLASQRHLNDASKKALGAFQELHQQIPYEPVDLHAEFNQLVDYPLAKMWLDALFLPEVLFAEPTQRRRRRPGRKASAFNVLTRYVDHDHDRS
jgi:hypothetical protein